MSTINAIIKHIEGTISTPVSVQNGQWSVNIDDGGGATDLSELVLKDNSGGDHVFVTEENIDKKISDAFSAIAYNSGTYTPTLTQISGQITLNSTPTFSYTAIGNVYHVFGNIDFRIDTAPFQYTISLPIPPLVSISSSISGVVSIYHNNADFLELTYPVLPYTVSDIQPLLYNNSAYITGFNKHSINFSYRV